MSLPLRFSVIFGRLRLFRGLCSSLKNGDGISSDSVTARPFWRGMANQVVKQMVVVHDKANNKFFIKLGSAEAMLEYSEVRRKSDGGEEVILNMFRTVVPSQMHGQGIAALLAKEAFQYVVDNKLKMQLNCSYLQKYFQDHPLEAYKNAVVGG